MMTALPARIVFTSLPEQIRQRGILNADLSRILRALKVRVPAASENYVAGNVLFSVGFLPTEVRDYLSRYDVIPVEVAMTSTGDGPLVAVLLTAQLIFELGCRIRAGQSTPVP